ncbi:MAG: ketopantoate reductase family protein [Anaerolineae bacterium]|nr:ketopantoate reductase family protein [Anaerolineae bacterium]
MSPQQRIAILGAGALGAAYASRFYDLGPACIAFVAAGERFERLQRDGVIVNGTVYPIPVVRPEATAAPADLILVALKHHHLPGALDGLERLVGEDTIFLSVMNGLDSEEFLGERFGMERVLYAVAVGIDAQRQGNSVRFSQIGTVFFGEADNTRPTPRVLALQALFNRAGIPWQTPPDMLRYLWWKFMINVGINQPSAVLRAPYGVFQTSPDAQAIMEAAMREVIALAEAAGVNLTGQDVTGWYEFLHTLDPAGKTSMLQDVEAGRKTEVEMFAGKVIALGQQYGIPTPVNEVLLHAINVIELGRAGSCDV